MRRHLAVLVLLAATAALPAPASAGSFQPRPWDGQTGTVTRIGGDTPRSYAVALSQAAHDDGTLRLGVVVSDQDFADALAASALAGFGGIFFAGPDAGLDQATLTEIQRTVPVAQPVYVVGGPAAVTPAVEGQLQALGYTVRRLSGPTRIETALAVADEFIALRLDDTVQQVLLARAFGVEGNPTAAWADSVAAGPAAAFLGAPVLLTPGDTLHPAVATWIDANVTQRATLLGGEAALAADIGSGLDVPVRRVAGPSRDATAARIHRQILREGFHLLPQPLLLVNLYDELGWAYGLAAAPVAALHGGAIIAVHPEVPLAPSRELVACTRPTDLLVAGPISQIPDARVAELRVCPDDLDAGSAAGSPLALRGDGLGADVDFGDGLAEVRSELSAVLGDPTADTGRFQPFCPLAGPEDPAGQVLTFGQDLLVTFREIDGAMFLHGWQLREGGNPLVTTAEGIGIGATISGVREAYGADASLIAGAPESFPPPIVQIDTPRGPLTAIADGNAESSRVEELYGGAFSFCE